MIQPAPQPAPHCPRPGPHIPPGYSWGIPIGTVLLCALIQARYTSRVFRQDKTQLVIEYAFLVNLAIEAGVAMRCQFPHNFGDIKRNCRVTTVSAGLATIVLLYDIYKKNQKFAPLGRGGIVHNGWVVKMRHWFVNLYHLVTDIGWANYVRIGFQLAQLVFRILELLMRYKLPRDGSSIIPVYIITNDFSVIPLIFATASWIPRLIEEQQKVIKSMNIMVLGYDCELRVQQQANQIPNPSPLVDFLLDSIPHPTTNLKSFDLWSSTIEKNQRELTLNMWEIRGSAFEDTTKWRLPNVDFIIIYFSLTDLASFQSVEKTWGVFILERAPAPRVPILLVGTNLAERNQRITGHTGLHFTTSAQGEQLALRVKAVAYIECNLLRREDLVNRLTQLMGYRW